MYKNPNNTSQKKTESMFVEETWLMYFNKYLLENEAISQREYEQMVEKIARRYSKYKKYATI